MRLRMDLATWWILSSMVCFTRNLKQFNLFSNLLRLVIIIIIKSIIIIMTHYHCVSPVITSRLALPIIIITIIIVIVIIVIVNIIMIHHGNLPVDTSSLALPNSVNSANGLQLLCWVEQRLHLEN